MNNKGGNAVKLIGLFLLMVSALFLVGCLKPVSLEDHGYVISVGVDKGVERKYYITLMLQRESSGQNSSVSEGGAIVLVSEGNDIFEAVAEMESNIPYILNFSRTNFLFFGSEAARVGMIAEFLDTPLDMLRIRASAIVIVTEGSVSDFVGGLAANNDANITKLQTAILLDRQKTGMVSVASVSRLYEAAREGRFDFCAALGAYDESIITDMGQKKSEGEGEDPISDAEPGDRIGGLKSHITGSALFNGWIMTDTLDRHETMLLNMVTGEFESGSFAYSTEQGENVFMLLQADKSAISFKGFNENGAPCFEVDISLYAGVHQPTEIMTDDEIMEWLSGPVASDIEQELCALLEKCKAAGSDAMRFGTVISKLFKRAAEWEAFDWRSRYGDIEVRFNVALHAVDKYSAEGLQ